MYARIARVWNGTSLRAKITGLILLLVALGLVVSSVGTQSMLRNYLTAQLDKQLESTAQVLNNVPASEAQDRLTRVSGLLPSQYLVMYFDADGQGLSGFKPYGLNERDLPTISAVSPRTHAKQIENGSPFNVTSANGDNGWRVLATTDDGAGALVVALPTSSVETTLAQYQLIFFTFGLLVLLASGLFGWWLAESLFSPLRRAERAAIRIAEGDYSSRLPGANPVTEVGRLNASLNAMSDDIERAFADRQATIAQMRRFVADAGHELRTPLVSVRGYAELYRMGAITDPDDIAKAMDRIEHEAIRMGHLVEDLLELARLDDPKPLVAQDTDLIALAEAVAMDARVREPDREFTVVPVSGPPAPGHRAEAAPAAGASAENDTDTGPLPEATTRATGRIRRPTWTRRRRHGDTDATTDLAAVPQTTTVPTAVVVRGEPEKLQQVMTNLTGNALRYTPAGSPIELACGYLDDGAFFEVRDHGDGIPEQIRDKIFQRFWRADTSRTRETGGTGLGLSIVDAIVRTHHGTVSVHDTPGGGATFRIELPHVLDHPTTSDAGTDEKRAADSAKSQPPAGPDGAGAKPGPESVDQ